MRAMRLRNYGLCLGRRATITKRFIPQLKNIIGPTWNGMVSNSPTQKYVRPRMGSDLPVALSLVVSLLMVLLALLSTIRW